jgi:glycosyltransferase involved in cell wall biosynthesis
MKIVHIITTICRGGAETQLLILVREQVAQKHDVSVFFLKGEPELLHEFQSLGVNVRFDLHNRKTLNQIYFFRKAVKGDSSVIHAHLPKSELIASLAKSRNQLLISRHNAEPFFPGAPTILSNLLSLWVSWRSDGCICISHAVKDFLNKRGELLSSRKTWIVHYGYNSTFDTSTRTKPSEVVYPNLIGTVSRLVPQKDLPTLLQAFKILLNVNPTLTLSIIGRGVEKDNLHQLARELQVIQSIVWTDKSANIYSKISSMRVFCLTSLYEGFGLVLLEAMQSRVPIVAARNSAIVEVLGAEYPYFFETSNPTDLANKIESLLVEEERDIAVNYLTSRLLMFSPGSMAKKISKIYEEINSITTN